MKRHPRFLVLLLTMLFAICLLAGCGNPSSDNKAEATTEEENTLIGKYTAVYDMKDSLNTYMGGTAIVNSVNFEFYLEIKDDNTYKLYTDENQIKESLTEALSQAMDGVLSKDDIKKMIDQSASDFNESSEGTYKADHDNITLTDESGSSYDGVIGKEGSITITPDASQEDEKMVFKK